MPRRPARKARHAARPTRQVGYAVIGLGHIAQVAVLPAFRNAKNARLVALVSSDREKLDKLGRKYKVKQRYTYDQLDECFANEAVDAVYICLPNDQHADCAVRAAQAGVHVLCEKPMAISEEECSRMIAAAKENDVRLMVAYRLHFEPANLRAVELARDEKIGEPKFFSSTFSYQVKDENIRTQRERGGGPQWDIGIYCINAARYLFRAEPVEVFAQAFEQPGDKRFAEIDATVAVQLKFPDERVASFVCSFGTATTGSYRLVGTKGDVLMDNAYEYAGKIEQTVTVEEKSKRRVFGPSDQFAPELVHFSECVLEGRDPEPSGKEGLADVRIIEAINRSIVSGAPVRIEPVERERERRPEPEMAMTRPAVREPELVNVEAPHG